MRELTQELLQVARLVGMMERDQVCCGTVTVPQCVVLQQLLLSECMVTELAGFAGLSPSAMTRLLDGLAGRGWVERVPAPDDRRKVLIRLTPEGKAEAQRLRGLTEESVAQVLSYVPEDRRAMVMESIVLLRQAVVEALEEGISCCGVPCGEDSK